MPRKATTEPVQEILPPEPEANTDLAILTQQTAITVLQDEEEFTRLYAKVKAETEKLTPDVSTQKGRDAIRSLARKVITTRTAIDKARLGLTSEWRDLTTKVNAANKAIEAKLDALADEVRKPLTDWEEAEKAREDRKNAAYNQVAEYSRIEWEDDSARIAERAALLKALEIDPEDWGDELDTFMQRKADALSVLRSAYTKAKQAEDAAAELARMQEVEAARLAAEAERLAQEKAEADAKEAAKLAEEKRAADLAAIEKAKSDAIAKAKQDAIDQAARDMEAKIAAIEAERQAEAKAKQDEIDAANARVAEIERLAKVEADRLAKESAELKAKQDAADAEQRERDENKAHRTKCKTEAKEHLIELGASEELAIKIVLSLVAKEFPHSTWSF